MKTALLMSVLLLAGLSGHAQNTNCSSATQVCSDVSFSGNSSGPGTQELPNNNTTDGCLTIEHQSSWYYFVPVTSGTVALTIQTAVDYDFAIWTSGNCNNLGSPTRCSYSAQNGNTGLAATNSSGNTVSDVSEGTSGDRWVMPLNVTAGQTYIMLIDNFTANSTPFTLTWTFTNGATLNCNPGNLPVGLLEFSVSYNEQNHSNTVFWSTASEHNNDHFTIERSNDAETWQIIHQRDGAASSSEQRDYLYEDFDFRPGEVNYYRLSQTDFDGTHVLLDIATADNGVASPKIVKMFNMLGQEVPLDTKGLIIVLYENGTTKRIYR
jgi:hypothetical protein